MREVASADFPCTVLRFFASLWADDVDFTKKYHAQRGDKGS